MEILFKKNFLLKLRLLHCSLSVFLSHMFHQVIVSLLALSSLMYSYDLPGGKWKEREPHTEFFVVSYKLKHFILGAAVLF